MYKNKAQQKRNMEVAILPLEAKQLLGLFYL